MTFFFAWADEGEAFDDEAHSVEDESIYSFQIAQEEGQFATLEVVFRNPRVGLLAPGRKQWAWFSEDGEPLFFGRLVALPDFMAGELVSIKFLACPADYEEQRETVTATLRVAPFWDPVMVPPDQRESVDYILEARTQLWHVDRVTHVVTVSDIVNGEDGLVDFAGDLFSPSLTYGQRPATTCNVHAEIRWKQAAVGSIDLSDRLYAAFAAANSVRDGCLSSYTGAGLQAAWPKVGASIGAGWSWGVCTCERVDGWDPGDKAPPLNLNVGMLTGGFSASGSANGVTGGVAFEVDTSNFDEDHGWIPFDEAHGWGEAITVTFNRPGLNEAYPPSEEDVGVPSIAGFQNWAMVGMLEATYDAKRDRVELVDFAMEAAVQEVSTASEDAIIDVSLTSGEVDQPIDAGSAIPIGDLRRDSYMLTDRGKQTLTYLMCMARARLMSRARCARVTSGVFYEAARGLSCRMNGRVEDPHLPGGEATGKVVSYSFGLDGDRGERFGNVVIACTVGLDGELVPTVGEPGWVDEGWVEPGWQSYVGGTNAVTLDLQYDDYDTTPIATDGVDLFNLSAINCFDVLDVVDGALAQEGVLLAGPSGGQWNDTNAAISALNERMTKVAGAFKPLTISEPLQTQFDISVHDLVVPMQIDLEAA